MASIGEASAIVAVAQVGISLSNTLIAYVGEVHDARFRIQRIGNEVLTTSERLKDIGELVEKNGQTQIFSEEGVLSAVRCSEECHKILVELRKVLSKGGWHQWMRGEEKVEIDLSLFSSLRWPFIKTKLEVPRAELERIKVDLTLLFSSAMALGASSAVEKAKYRQEIPGLNRTRDLVARMAEHARRRALDRENGPQGRTIVEDGDWTEGEPEMLQDFADFQERRMQEEEDKRLTERAALLLAEKEKQKRKVEEERHLLEKEILEKYHKEQAEIQARNERRKEGLRDELKAVGLGPDKIEAILESSTLRHNDMEDHRSIPLFPRPVSSSRDTSDDGDSTRSQTMKNRRGGLSTMNGLRNKWRLKLPWRKRKSIRFGTSPINSDHRSTSGRSDGGPVNTTMKSGSIEFEAWLIDVFSHEQVMLRPSDEWFKNEWNKVEKKGSDVWRQFARLKPLWRTAILQFLNLKNPQGGGHWGLFSIELPQRSSRTRLFDHKSDDQIILLIVFNREDNPSRSFGSYDGREGHGHGHNKIVGLNRPTYIKVHRKHLSPDTLEVYELPWEWDESDSNYIIIKRWIPEPDQEILFEHSRKIRERKLLGDTTAELKKERDSLLLVRKKSPSRKRSTMRYQTRQDSYGERHRVPSRSRFRSTVDLDSEDEDDVGARYTEQKSSPEPELTDEELIARTLQRFTTFKPDATHAGPLAIPTNSTSTAPLRPSLETKKKDTGTPEAIAPSFLQATFEPSGQASYSTPAGTSVRTKQEKQGRSKTAMSGGSQSLRPGKVTNHEISNTHVLGTGNILEEPTVMTEEPVTSERRKRQDKFADGTKSSKVVAARDDGAEVNTYSNKHRPSLEGRQSRSSYGRASVDGRHLLSSGEHDARSSNRGEAPSHPSELTEKELEINRLQRKSMDQKRGVAEQNQAENDNLQAKIPNSRSATVEDFVPDAEDRNGSHQTLSKAETLDQDEDRSNEAV